MTNLTTPDSFVSVLTSTTFATRHDSLTGEASIIWLQPGTIVGRLASAPGAVRITFGSYKCWVPESALAPVV